MLIVGTRFHLEDLDRSYTYAEDVSVTALTVGSFSGGAGSLLPGRERTVLALLDEERIVALDEFDMIPSARLAQPSVQSMAASAGGNLLIGLKGAHVMTVSSDGVTTDLAAFDQVQGRDAWTNPAGPTPDLRSIAVSDRDIWYVNVHVG